MKVGFMRKTERASQSLWRVRYLPNGCVCMTDITAAANNMADDKLEPCPTEGCEGTGEVQYHCGTYYVECSTCEGQGPIAWNENEAVTGWDHRPQNEAQTIATLRAERDMAVEGLEAIAASENKSANGFRIWAKRRAQTILKELRP